MDAIYGIVGFAGFEVLRIYKRLWAELPISPFRMWHVYVPIVVLIGGFAGVVSHALSHGNPAEAIFIGFSVPSGIKALLESPRGPERSRGIEVDDVELEESLTRRTLLSSFREYFRFSGR